MSGTTDPSRRKAPAEDGPAEQADRCRRLARATYDRHTAEMLEKMAADFEQHASENDD